MTNTKDMYGVTTFGDPKTNDTRTSQDGRGCNGRSSLLGSSRRPGLTLGWDHQVTFREWKSLIFTDEGTRDLDYRDLICLRIHGGKKE